MEELKRIGRTNIVAFGATFLPPLSAWLVLFFGYSISYFILGIPLLVLGLFCMIMRTYFLLRYYPKLIKLSKLVIDIVFMIVLVILAMVFTTAKIVETSTGFKIEQSGNILSTLGFAALFLTALILNINTNQKIGKKYFEIKKTSC